MIGVAAAALVLTVAVSTRDLDGIWHFLLTGVSGLCAVLAVPLLADLLTPGTRLWVPEPPNRNPHAEILLDLCSEPNEPVKTTDDRTPPFPPHLEFLVHWVRNFWVLILVIGLICVCLEFRLDAPEHEQSRALIWDLGFVAIVLCTASAFMLTFLLIWKHREYCRDWTAVNRSGLTDRPSGTRRGRRVPPC